MPKVEPLSPEQLCRRCDPGAFTFETTAELDEPAEVLGQERALEALRFGIGMARDGYNIFALGPPGLGKHVVARRVIESKAADQPTPPDWCYVNNFENQQKPRALCLPAGVACRLKVDMERLVPDLRAAVPAAFESDEYRTRKEAIEEEVKQHQEKALEGIQQGASEKGIALIRSPAGFGFAPVREGEVVGPEAFQALPEDERRRIQQEVETLQDELQAAMRQLPALVKETRRRLRELNREVTRYAVDHLIDELLAEYAKLDDIKAYLEAVREDVIDNADTFLRSDEGAPTEQPAAPARPPTTGVERYTVTVLVDCKDQHGAPVVY